MRIPLDYYRILGLPIQATAQQLSQAYRDRTLQLPRREYSEAAIASRKTLLEKAYGVLSDPETREEYDAGLIAKAYQLQEQHPSVAGAPGTNQTVTGETVEAHTPTIEIDNDQLLGSLLILQELGEYELVLKLAQPLLEKGDSFGLSQGKLGDPQLVQPDVVLTLAIACLELGREQWQQAEYENAAMSLETGQQLLLQEGLFPSVRGEIQADLYKLRPYRILELLALPEEKAIERRKGLRLLQEMLQERRGIDGTGNDQSGLGIDDFLRFIQQLRGYLTSNQQQTLFEAEARRPSAVATYLAVYALLARGFAHRQPALIARAKKMLMRLGKRQDVHLEQGVCALLLGQTEEASRALELSQEYEPLAFIREHSQNSPDLLPGLCLYGERWLQESVFPHFRDLANQKVSLKEYFADDQVQAYLENLPDSSEETSNQWTVVPSQTTTYATVGSSKSILGQERFSNGQGSPTRAEPVTVGSRWPGEALANGVSQSRVNSDRFTTNGVSTLPTAQGMSHSSNGSEAQTDQDLESKTTGLRSHGRRRRRQSLGSFLGGGKSGKTLDSQNSTASPGWSRGGSLVKDSSSQRSSLNHSSPDPMEPSPERFKPPAKLRRLIFLSLLGLLGLGILLILLNKALKSFSTPPLEGEQPFVQLDQPPVPIPPSGSGLIAPSGPINQETAQQVIETWLNTKKLAFGPKHQVGQLSKILAEPALSVWLKSAKAAKNNNSYRIYKHTVKINSVETSKSNPNQAVIDAAVKEQAKVYQDGMLSPAASSNDNLRVKYNLVRQGGQWLIKGWMVR
ncbi:MAG: DUF4101 domain-containing protein [Moorea sp. SIO3G5]|nr:DUF4101 domain-containing protein [Moorena sp. SIO3G5]